MIGRAPQPESDTLLQGALILQIVMRWNNGLQLSELGKTSQIENRYVFRNNSECIIQSYA